MKSPSVMRLDRRGFVAIGVFSLVINLLMLTSPMFMLQVYDRVLASRSQETLVALFLLVVLLFGAMAILDFVRGRIGARIGAGLQAAWDVAAFRAALRCQTTAPSTPGELESVRQAFGSPVAFAAFDVPFTPLFMAAIFIFHPLLGTVAIIGAGLLIFLALVNRWWRQAPARHAQVGRFEADRLARDIHVSREQLRALGMVDRLLGRWQQARLETLKFEASINDRHGGLSALSRSWRLLLQSAMLATGAYLVLQNELSPGAMIASSILLGRALAPVEQLIQGWEVLARATAGWRQLNKLLSVPRPNGLNMPLGRPEVLLEAQQLTIVRPNTAKPAIAGISFALKAGQSVAILGESASGKSTLLHSLAGQYRPTSGVIRLGGATLDRFGETNLASHIGYMPQEVALFEGSIAMNIARFDVDAKPEAIIQAARKAGADQMIQNLPQGYDTRLGSGGLGLSGGQKQRLGLARALFGEPILLLLDEPNANLDAEGSLAINRAVREFKEEGGIVIVTAHRPTAIIECDLALYLRHGRQVAFGPRDEVLRGHLRNHAQLALV